MSAHELYHYSDSVSMRFKIFLAKKISARDISQAETFRGFLFCAFVPCSWAIPLQAPLRSKLHGIPAKGAFARSTQTERFCFHSRDFFAGTQRLMS